jgi:hypothetical protein
MHNDDAKKDVLTDYSQPAEMSGTGEIVNGVVHRSAAAAGIHSGGSVVTEIARHQALRLTSVVDKAGRLYRRPRACAVADQLVDECRASPAGEQSTRQAPAKLPPSLSSGG